MEFGGNFDWKINMLIEGLTELVIILWHDLLCAQKATEMSLSFNFIWCRWSDYKRAAINKILHFMRKKEAKTTGIKLNWISQNDAEMCDYSLLVGYESVAIEGGL